LDQKTNHVSKILEKTDQYGAKLFLAQIKRSFLPQSATDIVEGLWRSLNLAQGIVTDWSGIYNIDAVKTKEQAAEIIKVRKLQDLANAEKELIKEKQESEQRKKDKLTSKFKVTKKTYV